MGGRTLRLSLIPATLFPIVALVTSSAALPSSAQDITENTTQPAFQVTFTERASTVDGKWDHPRTIIFAQREDGATAEVRSGYDEDGNVRFTQRTVNFPNKGISVTVDGKNNEVTTVGDGKPQPPQPPLGANCEKLFYTQVPPNLKSATDIAVWKDVAEDHLLGFRAIRGEMDGGEEDLVQWALPELGCAVVKTVHYWKLDTGQRSGAVTVVEAIEIRKGAPDAKLFEVPAGAVRVSPTAASPDR